MWRWLKAIWLTIVLVGYHLWLFTWELFFLLWSRPELLPSALRWWESSLRHSPYNAHRHYPELYTRTQWSEMDLVYGEIALPTVDKVLRHLALTPDATLLDLGSGRGRVIAMAASQGFQAKGIELIPSLVTLAEYTVGELWSNAHFVCGDLCDTTYEHADVIWLTGTCWHTSTLQAVIDQLCATAVAGCWIVSVTRPLQHPRLVHKNTLRGWTTWGREHFHIQQVVDAETHSLAI